MSKWQEYGRLGGRKPQRGPQATQPASIKITPAERETIEAAAAIDGKPWSSWMIAAAVAAARRKLAKVSRETT